MTPQQWKDKGKRKRIQNGGYSVYVSTGTGESQSVYSLESITRIEEVMINAEKPLALFYVFFKDGSKVTIDFKITKRHKQGKGLFGFSTLLPFDAQDYFDDPDETLKHAYKQHELWCDAFKNHLQLKP